ncbi:MAG: hypothetical protein ACRD1U_13105 [Vicinamibacterales bacterium]
MYRKRIVSSFVFPAALAAAVAVGGCGESEDPKTVSEAQSQTGQRTNQALTIAGCLKAGDAENTYVLTAARTAGSQDTATYQLEGEAAANLQDHVGERVEVTGTMNAQQEVASRTTAEPQADERPTGTSGTPQVVTKTEVDIKRVSVASVKPLAEKCDI